MWFYLDMMNGSSWFFQNISLKYLGVMRLPLKHRNGGLTFGIILFLSLSCGYSSLLLF